MLPKRVWNPRLGQFRPPDPPLDGARNHPFWGGPGPPIGGPPGPQKNGVLDPPKGGKKRHFYRGTGSSLGSSRGVASYWIPIPHFPRVERIGPKRPKTHLERPGRGGPPVGRPGPPRRAQNHRSGPPNGPGRRPPMAPAKPENLVGPLEWAITWFGTRKTDKSRVGRPFRTQKATQTVIFCQLGGVWKHFFQFWMTFSIKMAAKR